MERTHQNFKTTIKMTKYMIQKICKDRPGKKYVLIKIILAPIYAITPMLLVVIPGLIVNELTGNQRIEILALYIGLIVFTPLIIQLIRVITNKQLQKERMSVETRLQADLY